MQDLVVIDGKARGIARDLVTGEIERHSAHAVVASGGYGNVFSYLLAMGSNATAAWKIHKKGAFANPCYTNSLLVSRFRRSPI
jgi:succinate dehydrogenase / fumarate reductase flavoprotein subunit